MAESPTGELMTSGEHDRRLAELARVASVDGPKAIRLALSAKADGITDATVHYLVGLHLKEIGKPEEAVVELGHGLRLDPDNAVMITTVGFCLLDAGRREEAMKVFGMAVKLDPNSAEASYGFGWAAGRLGAFEAAQTGWERAVALNPDHADALAGLAGLAARRRDWSKARAYAERAARLDPRQTDALMNLAAIEIGELDFAAAQTRLRELLALDHLKPLARANARIMLGDALDGAERYREAFDAYVAGKTELKAIYANEFDQPNASAINWAGAILREFQATPPERWEKPPHLTYPPEASGHAFLLGFPRSGTTLLEQVLASHPDVVALEERPVLVDADSEFLTRPGGVERLSNVVPELLQPFRDTYWRRVREFGIDPVGKVFVDKNPLNTFRLPLIARLFPDARIIFAIRDPRDVVLSCFRRSFNMNASMYQFNAIETAARYYAGVMEAGEVYFKSLPVDSFRIRYEDLVTDFDGTTGALCDFLGIDRTDGLRDFAQTAQKRSITTPSSTQVGRGLYEEGMNQWRRYAFALEPVLPILRPWIEKFGYESA